MQCYAYLTNRCTIVFLLIINILSLKDRLLKILLVFCENQRFNFFSLSPSEQREKRQKQPFQAPADPVCKDRACRILPKWAVKSRMDSRIFWGYNCGILRLVEEMFCSGLIAPGAPINFAAKRENGRNHFAMTQPSLFFPHFDFTLMNVYMNKVVDFMEKCSSQASILMEKCINGV